MKKKELTSVRGKDAAQLEKLLVEKREALHAFRMNVAGSKVKNMLEGRQLRKEIAQILTILGEKATTASTK